MKKIILTSFILMLVASLVLAAEGSSGIHEPGTGLIDSDLKAEAQGTGQGLANRTEGLGQMIRVKEGAHIGVNGEEMQIQARENNRIQLKVNGVEAEAKMEMVQEKSQNKTKLHAKLSNGKNAEIKVMPDRASSVALSKLKLKNCEGECTIELKEVGSGENIKAAYEVKTQRESKIFGLFRKRMQVQAQVDAETGQLLEVKKPWWAFIASEPAE